MDIIANDAAAIGWDLSGVEIIPPGKERRLMRRLPYSLPVVFRDLPRASYTDVFMGGIVNASWFEPAIGYACFCDVASCWWSTAIN